MFQANETIRYLEFCVSSMNVQEQAIHNYLLTLYAQHKPDRLMRYLAMEGELRGVDCGKLCLRTIASSHKEVNQYISLSSLMKYSKIHDHSKQSVDFTPVIDKANWKSSGMTF